MSKKQRQIGSGLLIGLGAAAIVLSSCLLGARLLAERRAAQTIQAVLPELEELLPERSLGTVEETKGPLNDMPIVELGGVSYIGVLEAPTVGGAWPVAAQTEQEADVPRSTGGNVKNGTLRITGRSTSSQFSALDQLYVGDTVSFTDIDGVEYRYAVARISQETSSDSAAGSYDLRLVTSAAGGRKQLVIDCKRN